MRYNRNMETISTAIIGGGASGLFLANQMSKRGKTVLFERNDRLGKKLSATGNGQGNVSNLAAEKTDYFSVSEARNPQMYEIIRKFGHERLTEFFRKLGVLLFADERGRVYPSGRQASSLTDALRFALQKKGTEIKLSTYITDIEKTERGFLLTAECGEEKRKERFLAERVVLCAGGKAAKNFGTDGSAYDLAEKLGHRVTALYPSLVQLKTAEIAYTKTLKGIRVSDAALTAKLPNGEKTLRGDVIFTDYGISGDAVFRISAFITDKMASGSKLSVDFLPELSEKEIYDTLRKKAKSFPDLPVGELLFGIVNNQVGRAVLKRADGNIQKAAALIKNFPLTVTGSLGFDYAQVTKGGIPLAETDENLQSRFAQGLYFAGEIVDVDGPCGGFNLQWAFSSACAVAEALQKNV